jgi:exopolyphosphatase/guanosine-5'-triphosphate,3'-diphosphate pyrophosphatase
MISIKKYAAIDIGSNAMRLLITNIVEQEGKVAQFTKSSLVRVPVRLGQDSFTVGKIADENIERMTDAIKAYALLMKVHKVEKYMACATSAMREAANGKEVMAHIKRETEIKIHIISGREEAKIVASTDLHDFIKTDETYLYVDVGGGSTEISLFSNGEMITSKSFKAGTVRFLNNQVASEDWDAIEQWIKTTTSRYDDIKLIGSGGNINKLFKMSGKSQDKPLTYTYMKIQFNKLNQMSYEERVTELGLNADRADVIIPATRIYMNAMKWSGAKQIFVPKIGLSDGIVKSLYYNII